MIRDLDTLPAEDDLPDYDVCIVGSGPAGATVATELASSGLSVCVLESGRERPTRHGDALRAVETDGMIPIKDYSRERVLGGASTTWAGLSSPLDERDLAPRSCTRHADGWPIPREELFGCYAEASERYRFPPVDLFGAEGFGRLRAGGSIRPGWRRVEEKVFLACAEPQDFGREVRHVYEEGGVDLWLDATVLRLEKEEGRVTAARVRSRGGREAQVRARAFVVGTGGIENARLLLVSGIGNEYDQVGRYLMNHPKNYHGILRLREPVESLPYYFGCLFEGYAGYAGLRLTPAEQEERGLLNSYVRLEPLFPWSDNRGIEALVLFVKRSGAFFRFWKKRREKEVVELRDYAETGDDSDLQNMRKSTLEWLGLGLTVLANLPRVLQYLFYRLTPVRPHIRRVRVRNFMEMEPVPENRVTLGRGAGPYGEPLARVTHSCTELDRRSLVVLHEALVEELEREGVGTLDTTLATVDPWPIVQDASHHMGTTRMGLDPRTSVVDVDCRVHGTENLFMAGASVFPTSGCANPTFTLVALSIRLARHLREEVLA